jgi:integrase
MHRSPVYATVPCASGRRHALAVHEGGPAEPAKPRLLDRVRAAARLRHYSRRTEAAYIAWIRRYIFFHDKRHPAELGAAEVTRFLSSLAVDGRVAASTQNQALGALLFLYRDVLELDLPWLDGIVRAKRPERLPVVLTSEEVAAVLRPLTGVPRLMASLLYGFGLRLLECCRLRIQDIDFARNQIVIRGGKGDKDRVTMLPGVVKADLARHLEAVRAQHQSAFTGEPAGSNCPPRSPGSIPMPGVNGCGSGRFRRRGLTATARQASGGGITSTSPCSSAS